jgi:hypothetical protein
VIKHFSNSSLYLLEESIEFNKSFARFIKACFNIDISELIPFVQYSSKFFSMELDNCLPHHWTDECALEVNPSVIFRRLMKTCWLSRSIMSKCLDLLWMNFIKISNNNNS